MSEEEHEMVHVQINTTCIITKFYQHNLGTYQAGHGTTSQHVRITLGSRVLKYYTNTHMLVLSRTGACKYSIRLQKRNLLPAWRDFAHLCYLLQPTSARIEDAFSTLKIIIYMRSLSMAHLIRTTLMLRYNMIFFQF